MKPGHEKLVERMGGRKNQFDIIRFVAASLVVVTHAYATSLGHEDTEPFMLVSSGQSTLGYLAVLVFFVTSGFLITMSFDRASSLVYFLKARILRIFPALLIIVLFTVFLLGPLMTSMDVREYLSQQETYHYLRAIALWPMPYELPGVFEGNVNQAIVNGSLWTLAYEFLFYLVVAMLGIMGILKKRVLILTLFVITVLLSNFSLPIGGQTVELFSAFSSGMIFYLYRKEIPYHGGLALISLVILGLTVQFGEFTIAFPIFGGYLTFYLAYMKSNHLFKFGKYGDFSYGIYIYGYPIQQVVTKQFGGSMDPYVNLLISYPIILLFAYLSWHIVEKRSLKWKHRKVGLLKKETVVQHL
ncbi:acyltransferase [Alkalihalobacillus hwajinpoensis]|uniref:acyltransferase family protein n=1 Tax=Guptibacillus hwajinpoensis TaxID=208199 RepID=UPI001883DED8|nr:acyltransferase [Pseudalkalibacillus hwajinpoensis]MBF0705371.1 acyltransferase [Pseudalkalibacillus hwajinpoensis]